MGVQHLLMKDINLTKWVFAVVVVVAIVAIAAAVAVVFAVVIVVVQWNWWRTWISRGEVEVLVLFRGNSHSLRFSLRLPLLLVPFPFSHTSFSPIPLLVLCINMLRCFKGLPVMILLKIKNVSEL
jgi:hypothetical protein